MTQRKRHADRIMDAVQSRSAAAQSSLAASWRRSAERHGLDPANPNADPFLTAREIAERRGRLEHFLTVAGPQLDHLFQVLGNAGCGVLLTDQDGIVLDQRCTTADEAAFRDWGLWTGADWSEAAEGTNGIGTCLTEQRQVTIHRDDHFLARNTAMSCMDAPIFGPDGQLLAALDVSSARADQTEGYNRLIAAMVGQTAQTIEAEFFRACFPKARILVGDGHGPAGATLLAVDGDDMIVGATRHARKVFGLPVSGDLPQRPASDLFGRDDGPGGFEKAERAAVVRALARADGNVSRAARALGIGRATLYRRMKRLGLDG